MIISELFAQEIVDEMKAIISCDLNFMNPSGMIIASTDYHRKGSYHEGAKRAAKDRKDFAIGYDDEYVGTKRGMNMPVYFERKIVGVIGITGDTDEIKKYGKIIKKMTEILIKEAYLRDLDIREIEQHRALIEDLLFNDKYLKNTDLINQTNLFKVNATGPKVVVISKALYHEATNDEAKDKIFKIYYNQIRENANNLIMQSRDFNIMIIEFKNREGIIKLLSDIGEKINEKYNVQSKFGIGPVVEDIGQLKSSYLRSKIALDVASQSRYQAEIFYEDMDLELILNPIPKEMSKGFIEKTLKGLSASQLKEFDTLLKKYEKHNGSINKIADDLYMHKNTIQYKLNSFSKSLGYDMRNYGDFTILKIATTLKQLSD